MPQESAPGRGPRRGARRGPGHRLGAPRGARRGSGFGGRAGQFRWRPLVVSRAPDAVARPSRPGLGPGGRLDPDRGDSRRGHRVPGLGETALAPLGLLADGFRAAFDALLRRRLTGLVRPGNPRRGAVFSCVMATAGVFSSHAGARTGTRQQGPGWRRRARPAFRRRRARWPMRGRGARARGLRPWLARGARRRWVSRVRFDGCEARYGCDCLAGFGD